MSNSNYANGMMVNLLLIIGGVVFLVWLSTQPSEAVESQSKGFGFIGAFLFGQVGVFALLSAHKHMLGKRKAQAAFPAIFGVFWLTATVIWFQPFVEDGYKNTADVVSQK